MGIQGSCRIDMILLTCQMLKAHSGSLKVILHDKAEAKYDDHHNVKFRISQPTHQSRNVHTLGVMCMNSKYSCPRKKLLIQML